MFAVDSALLWRALRFAIVGTLSGVIHYGVLYLGVVHLQWHSTLASSVGFVVSVSFNYAMHYYWTFSAGSQGEESAPHGRALLRYLAMIGCGFLINGSGMYLGVHWLHLHYLLAQAMALVVVVAWNFTLANVWVFRAPGGGT